jgi:hypothetical protein
VIALVLFSRENLVNLLQGRYERFHFLRGVPFNRNPFAIKSSPQWRQNGITLVLFFRENLVNLSQGGYGCFHFFRGASSELQSLCYQKFSAMVSKWDRFGAIFL